LGDFDQRRIGRVVGADIVLVLDHDRLIAFIETGHVPFPPAFAFLGDTSYRLGRECNKNVILATGTKVEAITSKVHAGGEAIHAVSVRP
jgi:hypothetical protein